jgi:peroxiredoxin
MLPDLKEWEQTRPESSPEIVIFSAGPIEEVREMGLSSIVVHDPNFSVSNAYAAAGTPMGVLVNGEGKIASGVAAGAEAVLQLAGRKASPGQAAAAMPMPQAARAGDAAPPIHLNDVEGKPVDLADFRGRETVVLFWNTGCGFCQQMLPDLKAWTQTKPAGSPDLLVVSTGPVDDIRAMDLNVPVAVDEGFSLGPAYGANGTPIGVLVDGDGKIASVPAEGADAVFALVRSRTTAPFSA